MPYKVFISATQDDLDIARDLAQRLEAAGAKVFDVEKTVVPGDVIQNKGNRALREADEVIMVLTRDSSHSSALISELGMAMALEKRVVPLLVNLAPTALPPMFSQLQTLKYADLPHYFSEISMRAKAAKAA
jgi:hypothetical protein